MPGEHARSGAAGTGERVPRSRTGPRHAAPRKSILTKLQVPAGKAIAIAAMPTAVLMGMGLTPRLAQADELPKNPFTGHSCADETPDDSSSSSPSATPSPSGSSDSKDSTDSEDSSGDKASATPSPSATSSSKDSESSDDDSETAGKAASSPSPSPSASASKSTNPLDPLGIGDALGKLLGGGSDSDSTSSTPSASATPSPSATPQSDSSSDSGSDSSSSAEKSVEDTAKNVEKTVKDTTGKVTDKAEKATKDVTSGASASPSSDSSAYPCPTYDAKALADADYEKTSSLLPNDPWTLKTDLLTLHGLNYEGIVKVKTYDGTLKDVLKFTATGVDIKNLHQITEGPDGKKYHVQAREGSTSTFSNGTVTMYTEELKGNLFGIIPVTFSPKSPPPVNISEVFFSNVTVTQAGQFGGTLTIPGMHLYQTDN